MVSQAVLICNPESQHQELLALILKRIEGYITATQYMMISYNVTREGLARALAVSDRARVLAFAMQWAA